VEIDFPEILEPLFEPYRAKVLYGGRCSGKSWSIARALLIKGAEKPLRILCTREVQKSIKNSVHKLLSDQIEALGLSKFYAITQTEIKGINGTEFLFNGLSDQTADSIKSFESVDICWIEEAQAVSKRSLEILTPTIRKGGSEIWVSMNPELDSDPAYQYFVLSAQENSFLLKMNYTENDYFNETMEAERLHAERTMLPDEYAHIWLGKCKPAVSGAIYAGEIAEADGRICSVPYDPSLKVQVIFDLGWNDKMSVILVQKHYSEVRFIESFEDSHKTLDWYSAELRKKNYNWGTVYLPHDGDHKDYKTGKSAKQIMQDMSWQVEIVPNQSIEGGIRLARMMFARCVFDKVKNDRLIQCLRRYRRSIPTTTGEAGSPVHDEFSHMADAFRYVAVSVESMSNETFGGKLNYPNLGLI
jgi:phage terminase large subunit